MSKSEPLSRRAVFRHGGWVGRRARDAWCIVGLAAFGFVALDQGAARLFDNSGIETLVRSPRFRQASPELADGDLKSLAAEIDTTHDSPFVATRFRWEPLVYWRSQAHAGRWINIDENGLRRTADPSAPGTAQGDSSASARQDGGLRVFCFGGSTMWGACVSDEATIPSLLAAELAQKNVRASVTNFAQMGYVSTQSRVALEQELMRGNVPDVAVFYDGFNDLGAAMANAEPGLPGDEYQRPPREALIRRPTLFGLGGHFLRSSFIARLFQPDWRAQVAGQIERNLAETSGEVVVNRAVDRYLNNIRMVQALSARFDFQSRFYWQPLLCSRAIPSVAERELLGAEPGVEQMHRTARQRLGQILGERGAASDPAVACLRDLSGVFDGENWREKTAFFDACHLGQAGNRAVAAEIAADIQALASRQTGHSPDLMIP